jgi:hypothetical protein
VRVNEQALCSDYVHAPFMLSSERMDNETTWSLGEYVSGKDIWKNFKLPGLPPAPIGVYENQPSPLGAKAGAIWLTFTILAMALLFVLIANYTVSGRDRVFLQNYVFYQNRPGQEPSFVTPVFELKGRTSNIEVQTKAALNNEWIYLNYALINDDTGQAYDFGREVSYYSGRDSDGAWTEGNREDSVFVPAVPSGRYYLRVEPESSPSFGPIQYSVAVIRDVPVMSLYLVAFIALLFPALLISWRAFNFEQMRWAESDHPLVKINTSDD